MFNSTNSPMSWDPGRLTGVKGLPGRFVLAAGQQTCANTAAGTGKAPERMEKHQTLGLRGERSDSCRVRTG